MDLLERLLINNVQDVCQTLRFCSQILAIWMIETIS
jgi:hypothetical protein